jgi:hypothetical protein
MALQSSGQIALSDIRTELEGSGQISLNDSSVRDLIGKAANAENSLSEYYGASAGAAKPNALAMQARRYNTSGGNPSSTHQTATTNILYRYVAPGKNSPGYKQWYETGGGGGKFSWNYSDLTSIGLYGSNYCNVDAYIANPSNANTYVSRWLVPGTASSGVSVNQIMAMDIYVNMSYPSGVNKDTSSWTLNIDWVPAKLHFYQNNQTTTPVSTSGLIETRYGMGWTSSDKQVLIQVANNSVVNSYFQLRFRLFARAAQTLGQAYQAGANSSYTFTSPSGFYIADWVPVPNGQISMVAHNSSDTTYDQYGFRHYNGFIDVDGTLTGFKNTNSPDQYTSPSYNVSSATIS